MKKVLGGILLVVYSIIAITVTILLLSYNEYNCSEIGGYTVYIVNDDSLEPEYKQGSVLLIKHTSDKNVQSGDDIFLYKVINSQEYEFVNKTLEKKTQQGNHITYVTDSNENYDSSYFVGKTSDTVVIEGWGYLLSLLESKWGYLFCVVIVSLLLFLQEVFELSMEIKYVRETKKARKNSSKTIENDPIEVKEEPKMVERKTTTRPRTTNTTKTSTEAKSRTTKTTKTSVEARPKTTKTGGTSKSSSATKKTTSKGAKTASKKTVKVEKEANSEEE